MATQPAPSPMTPLQAAAGFLVLILLVGLPVTLAHPVNVDEYYGKEEFNWGLYSAFGVFAFAVYVILLCTHFIVQAINGKP